jgi:alpha-galactosidase
MLLFGAVMGWNTWCTDDFCGLVDICTEQEIRSVADGIVAQGLDKLGYIYLNLDDCWSDTSRSLSGELQPNAV